MGPQQVHEVGSLESAGLAMGAILAPTSTVRRTRPRPSRITVRSRAALRSLKPSVKPRPRSTRLPIGHSRDRVAGSAVLLERLNHERLLAALPEERREREPGHAAHNQDAQVPLPAS